MMPGDYIGWRDSITAPERNREGGVGQVKKKPLAGDNDKAGHMLIRHRDAQDRHPARWGSLLFAGRLRHPESPFVKKDRLCITPVERPAKLNSSQTEKGKGLGQKKNGKKVVNSTSDLEAWRASASCPSGSFVGHRRSESFRGKD